MVNISFSDAYLVDFIRLSHALKSLSQRLIIVSLALGLIACAQQQNSDSSVASASNIQVTDFRGKVVTLNAPAKRIVALAPHTVENVYSAGAGERLIGVIEYSDFPIDAQQLPIVGSYQTINFEKILALQPDLILAWESGNSHAAVTRLEELGFPVYLDEPHSIGGIAKSLRDIGVLAGTQDVAEQAANALEENALALRDQYRTAESVTVFYQVWNSPLQTINGSHIISDVIETCGGVNIYADEFAVAPVINIESVLERNPQAIIAGGTGNGRPAWLDEWLQWPNLSATRNEHLFHVNPDHTQRHTVRLLLGMQAICQQLDEVRATRRGN